MHLDWRLHDIIVLCCLGISRQARAVASLLRTPPLKMTLFGAICKGGTQKKLEWEERTCLQEKDGFEWCA